MPPASRVQLMPPAPWDEEALVAAARGFVPTGHAVRPGDAVGEMIVVGVEPVSGATLLADTEIVMLPAPKRHVGALVDMVILLDVSDSTGIPWDGKHTRLGAARATLASFLDRPGDSVASLTIIEYAKEARIVAGPAAPGEITLHESPAPKGSSRTATALDAALAHLASRIVPDRSQVIMLLTDGVGEVTDLLAAADRAGRLKVPVHALVFAPEVDEVFAEIAKATSGSFQRAGYPLIIEFEHDPGPQGET